MTRVLVINDAAQESSTGHLFEALAAALRSRGHAAEVVHVASASSGKGRAARLLPPSRDLRRAIRQADVLVLHTSVVFNAWDILIARATGTRIGVIYWDSYPESFNAVERRTSGPVDRIFGAAERFLLRRSDVILPPSEDYLPHLARLFPRSRVRVLPMWPFTPVTASATEARQRDRVEIGFAGAVNAIRGLDHAAAVLGSASRAPVALHTYGSDAPELGLPESGAHVTHVHHGFIPQDRIMARLATHDFGLVSLHPAFGLPAFPSKTLSYLCAGLPILYVGPRLDHYERILAETGIGTTLHEGDRTDLGQVAADLRADMPEAQARALDLFGLNEARLADILQ
ncbi:hypothetical protein OB2597_13028 [Pseudooceanicola batsensis HTCC2597]|uniref:Glycosyltransferase subfamily 4-like N-terminal domain-containing protein n=1 Tax=Pseudooceanicola batsensis (strain ATCC BAA-863 / DSM 15984 / KCTC 12145 / HTCC2597) TaxID=252305 RepID=A3TY34_PSEBH|nr:glycosyltransferase [Pseudooceanicola batsensis]EAQ03068.1 hypothetical protein OB2597_13028 [Pseudooceanicola batsensis HTCC2597]